MQPELMKLKVLLPFRVFADVAGISSIVVETRDGSLGLLPHRLDCVAELVPGILSYECEAGEVFIAVTKGILVKYGLDVVVSVRDAMGGSSLDTLHGIVSAEFLQENEQEQKLSSVMEKEESGLLRRLAGLARE